MHHQYINIVNQSDRSEISHLYKMEIEEQVVDEAWKGSLPIRVSLAKIDIASHEMPQDYYVMVTRNSYLPNLIENVSKHFELYTASDFSLDTIWFSYNGVPLKWHYQIGLLVDMNSKIKEGMLSVNLPFHIEVHFHRYPTEELLPFNGIKSIRSIFQNSLKESTALLLGTSAPVMNLSRDQEETMWKCKNEGNFKQFREIGSAFIGLEQKDCRYLPVKFLVPGSPSMLLYPLLANENFTILEAAKLPFPEFKGRFVCQGICLPENSELFWLWKNLSHPDNFLYIILLSE